MVSNTEMFPLDDVIMSKISKLLLYDLKWDHLGEVSNYSQQRSIEAFRLKYDKHLDTQTSHVNDSVTT